MPFDIQPGHLLVIILVALLVFGPKRLPEMGRNLGKTITEFRRGAREMTDVFREDVKTPGDAPAAKTSPVENRILPGPAASVSIQSPFSPASSKNICAQCGAPNLSEARFCNSCGTKLSNETV